MIIEDPQDRSMDPAQLRQQLVQDVDKIVESLTTLQLTSGHLRIEATIIDNSKRRYPRSKARRILLDTSILQIRAQGQGTWMMQHTRQVASHGIELMFSISLLRHDPTAMALSGSLAQGVAQKIKFESQGLS